MYTLIRERDNLTKQSEDICYIEWDENGFFKEKHNIPAIGRSLLMSPFNKYFTWQTTLITKIISSNDDILHFKTENSTYILKKEK